MVNIMGTHVLAPQGARASATMILTNVEPNQPGDIKLQLN